MIDQSHLTPFPLQVAPTYWSYDHTLRLYPLPTAVVLCDTSGWGPFKVTYEGCCVINTGSLLRVDQGDGGRGRYTAAWWEWDCGMREGSEVVVGITERQSKDGAATKEKKERKRKVVEKIVRDDSGVRGGPSLGKDDRSSRVVLETQVEESQLEEDQGETQMEDFDYGEEMAVDE